MRLKVNRLEQRVYPDSKRVIARFFMPGTPRAKNTIEKIAQLSDRQVNDSLGQVLMDFSRNHRNITNIFEKHYRQACECLKSELNYDPPEFSQERILLTGSYFTMEYSIEAAAFFNPSIIPDPIQEGLEEGQKRVIITFRAVGEGHISSLVFRSAILTKENQLIMTPAGPHVEMPETFKRHVYDKESFRRHFKSIPLKQRAEDQDPRQDLFEMVMGRLGDNFIYGELLGAIEACLHENELTGRDQREVVAIKNVAHSHYEIKFSLDTALSERVIFPFSAAESKGIEDMRFVEFIDDDGSKTYISTYTAYSDRGILPKIIATDDFYYFKVSPLNGANAMNKGMALFPRRINGRYAMLARTDGVNNYVTFSDNLNVWDEKPTLIQEPTYPWELTQVGNCGSPLETEDGWLLLTHGVGPMRTYAISAMLLDRYDPTKVIGRLTEPLIIPEGDERNGYVPNVVYSCGSLINNGELIIPYGLSDCASGFATIPVATILSKIKGNN